MRSASRRHLLAAGLAGALVSVLSYEWIFKRLSRAAMVASLLASIGLAFLVRSLITLVVGHDQRTFNIPLMRAWNFEGIRLLPTDLGLAAVALVAALLAWLVPDIARYYLPMCDQS